MRFISPSTAKGRNRQTVCADSFPVRNYNARHNNRRLIGGARFLSLWERAARQPQGEAPGEGSRSSRILRPSPYPLPEGEGGSSVLRFVLTFICRATASARGIPF